MSIRLCIECEKFRSGVDEKKIMYDVCRPMVFSKKIFFTGDTLMCLLRYTGLHRFDIVHN